ncbi:hypothetical protein K501DRAFT_279032 [Backusella circina FSU 941]|nr:hypothetical protein K501DRAFT_279032 [Backusella circina FSU 941]
MKVFLCAEIQLDKNCFVYLPVQKGKQNIIPLSLFAHFFVFLLSSKDNVADPFIWKNIFGPKKDYYTFRIYKKRHRLSIVSASYHRLGAWSNLNRCRRYYDKPKHVNISTYSYRHFCPILRFEKAHVRTLFPPSLSMVHQSRKNHYGIGRLNKIDNVCMPSFTTKIPVQIDANYCNIEC